MPIKFYGRCANLSQIACQICTKLQVFHFVHQRKGAQSCRKNFGPFCANTLTAVMVL